MDRLQYFGSNHPMQVALDIAKEKVDIFLVFTLNDFKERHDVEVV